MSAHLTPEQIESLALGEEAPDAAAHAASCPDCARELAWARAERALLARRPLKPVAHLWAGIEQRIAPAPKKVIPFRPRHAVRRYGLGAAVGLSAAAALLLVVQRHPAPVSGTLLLDAAVAADEVEPDVDPVDAKALAALDRAEGEVQKATTVLEAEYRAVRPQLDPAEAKKWDAAFSKARAQLGSAQKVAALDVQARLRVLDGYSGYLRSLRNVVATTSAIE